MNTPSATEKGSTGTNVQVAVRCRPPNAEERRTGQPSVVTCDIENRMIRVAYGPIGKKITKNFTFDKVFGAYSRQEEVFNSTVKPIVEETLAGFNCTIFAYGQTGTGKTHTMEGDINSEDQAGIVPRSIKYILNSLEASGSEFTIRVSFLELYNEELQDLLNTSGDKKLKLCEDLKKGVVCQNLEEIVVLDAAHILDILQRGIQQRATAATLCNKNSSRSHSIFTMKIMIKEYNVEGEEIVRHGQLNLVDLAGSECIGRSGAKNDRAREAGSINQSLLTLGRVITALVDHHPHVPYRDSKLTRLLQESLGGKAKTCIIATLSPCAAAVEESMSTLDYAHRAKNIRNQPTINQKLTKRVIMKEYFAELETLRCQLAMTREKNGVYMDLNDYTMMTEKIATLEGQLSECESALKLRNEEYKIVKNEFDTLTNQVDTLQNQLDSTTKILETTTNELNLTQNQVCLTMKELHADESVIQYQNQRENQWKHFSTNLQNEIHLHVKELDHYEKEMRQLHYLTSKRSISTTQFLQSLTSQQNCLMNMINEMSSQLSNHADMTSDELEKIFLIGKNRSNEVRQLVEKLSLNGTQWIENLEDLTNVQIENLSKLYETQMNQFLKELTETSMNWISWMEDLQNSYENLTSTISSMEKQSQVMSNNVSNHVQAVALTCTQFEKTEGEFVNGVTNRLSDLESIVRTILTQFQEQQTAATLSAKQAMSEQSRAVEATVTALLRRLVHDGHTAMDASIQSTQDFSAQVQSSLNTNISDISNSLSTHGTAQKQAAQDLVRQTSLHQANYQAQQAVLASHSMNGQHGVASLQSSLSLKRSATESADSARTEQVEQATKRFANESHAAQDVLKQQINPFLTQWIPNKTKALSSVLENDLQEWSNGIQDVKSTIQTHFNEIQSHCDKEKDEVKLGMMLEQEFNSELSDFPIDHDSSRVVPAREVVAPQVPMEAMKSHSLLRHEARSMDLALPEAQKSWKEFEKRIPLDAEAATLQTATVAPVEISAPVLQRTNSSSWSDSLAACLDDDDKSIISRGSVCSHGSLIDEDGENMNPNHLRVTCRARSQSKSRQPRSMTSFPTDLH